jgi:hypothetical protein
MSYPPIPANQSIPQEILDAHNGGNLALFLGAGISASMGCVDWGTLARNLVAKCLELGFINYADRQYFDGLTNNVRVISACYNKFNEKNVLNQFYSIVLQCCQVNRNLASNFCLELKSIANYYLTTNYDDGFDKYFSPADIVFRPEDYEKLGKAGASLESGKLYHIHGSVTDPPTMVLTEMDYGKKYSINFMNFLVRVFEEHPILFIGYSLEEEVIKYLIANAKQRRTNRHFILKRYFSNQTLEYKQESELLFATSGIQVVSYIGDDVNFQEMINIIKSWGSQMAKTEISMQ